MECTNCSFFECVDSETNQWQCGDPLSWYNPKTADEVCRYQDGAVQRGSTVPLSVVEEVLKSKVGSGITLRASDEIFKSIKQKAGV